MLAQGLKDNINEFRSLLKPITNDNILEKRDNKFNHSELIENCEIKLEDIKKEMNLPNIPVSYSVIEYINETMFALYDISLKMNILKATTTTSFLNQIEIILKEINKKPQIEIKFINVPAFSIQSIFDLKNHNFYILPTTQSEEIVMRNLNTFTEFLLIQKEEREHILLKYNLDPNNIGN